MNGDIFVNNKENPFGKHQDDEDNFFLQPESIPAHGMQAEPARRLNDYDYNILKEDAYKDVTDELFKLEYKISKAEDDIKNLEAQIQAARDIRDFELVETLFNRKKILQEDLKGLIEIYNDTSLSAKISGGISLKLKTQFTNMKKAIDSFNELVISKLPKRFSSVLEVKKSLNKLENINKSVDELMTLQTPYGEAGDKYEQLSRYISRANTIQAEIAKYLR